ncbi:hypothetical protein lbkm_0370 [Lachnospiraceae bacterium KM106-2]|nr:hypothetical protein lbkm_0370 [Lachnospiraceae bacterium KM106-2]
MELRLDAAIDKTENLARDVEINHMMMTFDSLMVKAQDEKVSAMIAEPNSQYGADVFEESIQARWTVKKALNIMSSTVKKDCKSR